MWAKGEMELEMTHTELLSTIHYKIQWVQYSQDDDGIFKRACMVADVLSILTKFCCILSCHSTNSSRA